MRIRVTNTNKNTGNNDYYNIVQIVTVNVICDK